MLLLSDNPELIKNRINKEIESKHSYPDFILTKKNNEGGLKSLVIDAKSHLNEIEKLDIDKIIDDCKVHKCHGVMVISETAYINEKYV